ncbi:hypothetical protein VNI00_005076 [Paramarasmius palmivorus]|uniref:SGNH hydrolase-type esterase domain-containing protein n=1 Tax=Paramarasmius palmivorus TaxID=297713 RepID=A0AAW0DIS5_9AGAR
MKQVAIWACFYSVANLVLGQTPDVSSGKWVPTWTAMPQEVEFWNLPPSPYTSLFNVFANSTIRQTVHTSLGAASHIRIQISNTFGPTDLAIDAVTVGLPVNGSAGVSALEPGTVQEVTFSGEKSFAIPNGVQILSDPIPLPVGPESMLSVSIYLRQGQQGHRITGHPWSMTTSWLSLGDQVNALELRDPSAISVEHWYFLSAVEAWVPSDSKVLVALGDSITDGAGSTTNANNRWPDLVLSRLRNSSNPLFRAIAVVNQAALGNRATADVQGPSTISRIERDVLSLPGVQYAILFEGINDIGVAEATPQGQFHIYDQLILAYQQVVAKLHRHGIAVFGATITPFGGVAEYYDAAGEREKCRQRVNQWIRESGVFDAVLDFDAVLRDENDPTRMKAEYYTGTGDLIHPGPEGYEAIAAAFPIEIFEQFKDGAGRF